jgi:hypothetical protein
LHRDKVLEPLKGYNTIFKHLYATKYKWAIFKEFTRLIDREIFEYKEQINEKLVLLIWVYTNKFDKDKFLANFKAKLITKRIILFKKRNIYSNTCNLNI